MKAAIGTYSDGQKVITGLLPSDVCIDLDPGHGTREFTPGKRSADGRYFEGEWSRVMVKKLADAFRGLGFGVNIVVPERMDISLADRCRRANVAMKDGKYHVYLSIHTNAAPDKSCIGGWCDSASGLEVYAHDNAGESSRIIAHHIYEAGVAMGLKGNRAGSDYKTANYAVLRETKMPAVLTESAFHTNRKEVDWLLSEAGQETVVNYHVAGVCKAFGVPYSIVKG